MEALIGRVGVNGKGVRGMALSKAEMKELLMQAAMEEEDSGDSGSEEDDTPPPKTKRLSKAKEKATEAKTVKAGKHAKSQQTNGVPVAATSALPTPVFDLVEPTFEPSTKKKSKQKISSLPNGSSPAPGRIDDSDFVEPTSLAGGDQADSTKRKRELQFHTSRIKKRAGKERASFGGDDDIPYRSDRRKNQMLQPDQDKDSFEANSIPLEGNRRVWGQSSSAAEPDDGGDGEWGGIESEVASGEGVKRTRASVEADEAEGGDAPTTEYLELVRSAKRQKKEEKRDAYLVKEAEKRKSYEDDAVLGPRTLTKDMLHNRGLTPRRKKKSANPWTKKRIQYEKAQKKLSSTRAVYKGGENALGGQYEGEMTGITRDVIKSVKFG
ncbi:hypothetical protein FRB99_002143 [Tulasnella sp. 403]|nr:hypothetical protein FRB99_002143 [Tulasnella sp. 403]